MTRRGLRLSSLALALFLSGCPKHEGTAAADPELQRFAGEWRNDVDADGPQPDWHWRLEPQAGELACICVYDHDAFDMNAGDERVEILFQRKGGMLVGKKMIGPKKWARVEGTPSADGTRISMKTWGQDHVIHEWALRRAAP